jgi:hypothetical protein
MIVREPNGEPKVADDLGVGRAMQGLTWHRNAAFVRKLIAGSRAWQRIPALVESSRSGRQARGD